MKKSYFYTEVMSISPQTSRSNLNTANRLTLNGRFEKIELHVTYAFRIRS